MREIVLDTETTGLKPNGGDRLVEIGCIELVNHVASGESFQRYINPERDMPDGAFQVHGLSSQFLADKPVFADVAEEIRAFLGEDKLIIHNAAFDLGFLNAEFKRVGGALIAPDQAIDTVALARKKYPGAPASLDALCRRFEIDNSHRTLHGALLDAELLAEVYLELIGGRQPGLVLGAAKAEEAQTGGEQARTNRPPRPHAPSGAEKAAHAEFVATLDDPIWGG
ncbi:MAG: DNA polymerase III subunit epsilon [Rhodospirillaceae bacterium]|jgi:DNA polymerase III subunit epsilon|nr:DNA polymerase III subunit epsilon [Rhodospirillaceae bacterium]MBT3928670.1 DNA polymerase III subunit epsilon [Rhodospirillaceae bacterium]MBT4426614.1 DNA polymerase III subunit epsilon [Rhodospirillaceae bacterium]MBT5676453.1 DNA polymerase III subunit epsilon [Rhodospirillaceae bacterium]MBT5778534.1 DNA polymerase III subunit epsilon [Rhodospirillaceae bacterium]